MNVRTLTSGAFLLTLAACDGVYCGDVLIDACRKAEDLAGFVGTEVAASHPVGNAVIGEGGGIHRQGRLSIGLRANTATLSAPVIGRPTLRRDGITGTTFQTRNDRGTSFGADLAVGAFRGFRVRATRVGGVDLLGNLTRTPAFGSQDFRARSKGLAGVGIGLRLGVVQETRSIPGVSLTAATYVSQEYKAETGQLPLTDSGTVSIALRRLRGETGIVRVAASKQFGRFGLTGGVGTDSYHVTGDYRIKSADPLLDSGWGSMSLDFRRNNAFGGGSIALGKATLGVEAGTVFGGRQPALTNTFGERRIDRARGYVTVGVKMAAGRTLDVGR